MIAMRLIDADALNYSTHTECAGHGEYYDIEIITKSKIDNTPTIDAVEVVRCKDCQYHEWCIPKQGRTENDYCSRGKRREL